LQNLKQYIQDEILVRVEKPARYLGNEWNSIHKSWDKDKIKMAFCFPDIYEIAMSHLGMRILYGLINKREDFIMERCFAPWVDMEQILREKNIPLFSLESYRPLQDFDVVGFTLQYEMSYTNILNMLNLGGIALEREQRDNDSPLVIAGGPCVYNPEPLAPFVDCFLIGDSEELLPEFLEVLKKHKMGDWSKEKFLAAIKTMPGIYVPKFYEFKWADSGLLQEIIALDDAPSQVKKLIITDFDKAYFPTDPIIPYIEAVHDRIMLEVARGCTRGCRFCQAGIVYRPVREKSPKTLYEQAKKSIENTGYDEISLTSLSTADYSSIKPVIEGLLEKHAGEGIGVSLPSLRVDAFSVEIAKEIQKVRKTGLTFAPEAGTQRLRDVINKGVTSADLEKAVKGAFDAGWTQIKLYFMIGLPTETFEDVKGIADLAYKVLEWGQEVLKNNKNFKRIKVTVSTSSFVPKAHTPFQWEPQNTISELEEKQQYLKSLLKDRRITYNYHDAKTSFLEAIISKGDRRIGKVLKRAWELGCKFDSWSEYFKYDKWLQAFRECEIDPEFYAYRRRDYDEIFPWDVIDVGVTKNYLKSEHRKALQEALTHDCRYEDCPGCGICNRFGVDLEMFRGEQSAY